MGRDSGLLIQVVGQLESPTKNLLAATHLESLIVPGLSRIHLTCDRKEIPLDVRLPR
jgi:hypothetical protein